MNLSDDIGKKTKSSLIWNTALKLVYQVFKFAISIIVARLLDPKDFGIMGMATIVVFYANSVTNFGFNRALVQRKDINESHINTVFTIDIAISFFLTGVILLFAHNIAGFLQLPELTHVLFMLSPIFIMTTFYQIPVTLFKRSLDFKVVAIVELYRGIFQSIVTLALAFMGYKYWALVIGLLASQSFGVIYLFFVSEWKPKIKYNHCALKDVFHFGLWNFIRVQSLNVSEHADKFIIGKLLGPALLGLYEKAFSIAAMQKQNFTLQFNAVMFASFSRIQSKEDEKKKAYLRKSISISTLLTFPIGIAIAILGNYFVLVLLGQKWKPIIIPLKILSLAFIFNSLGELISNLNIGVGAYAKQTIREICCNILLVFICLLVVQKGIEFVAFGVFFNSALLFVLSFQLTKKTIGFGWEDLLKSITPAAIGSLVMAALLWVFKGFFLSEINLLNFLLLSIIGFVSFGLSVLIPKYNALYEFRQPFILFIRKHIISRISFFHLK